ncbi:MAG: aldehyde dehydrogenase family protein, partial [Phyllobacteriaceae bacterium]|nr:aldehyde dehydrogenase family protein [Phyllobacteriaceae bacterium]
MARRHRTARRHCRHFALEFPAGDFHRPGCRRSCCGKCRCRQACRTNAAYRPARERPVATGGGAPNALRFIEGDGSIGAALTADPRIAGTVFTGSNDTARAIDVAMAGKGNPDAILVAETGGLNALIVDSTALLEQATRDVVLSAFQSAGQRCSALRL